MRFTDRKTLFTDLIPLLSIRSIRMDRQTVYNSYCHENILSALMRCDLRTVKHSLQTLYPFYRSVRSVWIDKPYITTLAIKIFQVPLMRCDLRTVKHPLQTVYPCCRSVRSVRTVTVRVYWTTLSGGHKSCFY